MGALERPSDLEPAEVVVLLILRNSAVSDKAGLDVPLLFLGQEERVGRGAREEEERGDAEEDGKDTLLWRVSVFMHRKIRELENRRTKMKIHAQPGLPPRPSIFWMPAASNPEKAPESDAAEKNSAILPSILSVSPNVDNPAFVPQGQLLSCIETRQVQHNSGEHRTLSKTQEGTSNHETSER